MDNDTLIEDISPITFHPSVQQQITAALIIFIAGIIGIFFNLSGLLLSFRVRALRSSFGYLTAAHCAANVGVLSVFVAWAAPLSVFNFAAHDGLLGVRIGQLSLYFWFAGLYSQLFIALNRFCLLFTAGCYQSVFTRRTPYVIAAYWAWCLVHYSVYFGNGCDFFFNRDAFYWQFSTSQCGALLGFWLDFIFGCTICVIVLMLDAICVYSVHRSNNILSGSLDSVEKRKRSKKEAQFILQAACTGVLFTVMLVSFHVISRFVSGLWPSFITTTFMWEFAHLGDGLILFAFNAELREALLSPRLFFSLGSINSRTTSRMLAVNSVSVGVLRSTAT